MSARMPPAARPCGSRNQSHPMTTSSGLRGMPRNSDKNRSLLWGPPRFIIGSILTQNNVIPGEGRPLLADRIAHLLRGVGLVTNAHANEAALRLEAVLGDLDRLKWVVWLRLQDANSSADRSSSSVAPRVARTLFGHVVRYRTWLCLPALRSQVINVRWSTARCAEGAITPDNPMVRRPASRQHWASTSNEIASPCRFAI